MPRKTSPPPTSANPPSGGPPGHERRWWALVVIGTAQLMVVLDATIVNIALPSAQSALDFTDGDRQWILTSYALPFGSLLLLGGRLADVFGRKQAFLAGLVGFAVASALGGAATSFEMLIAARAGQGVSGALLAPAALSLLTTTFTDLSERAKAFSVFGAIAGAGGAVGLLLGGVLTEYLTWRWCLYVNLFFAVVAFIGGLVTLPGAGREERRPGLDLPGTVLVSVGVFSLVYGTANAETDGWDALTAWGYLVAGALLLVGFVWWQTKASRPLLPLHVVLDRNRGASFLSILVIGCGLMGIFLFLTYYLQLSLGYSALSTGLAFLPLIGAMGCSPVLAAGLVSRIGPRPVIPAGMAVTAVGLAWLTTLDLDSGYVTGVLPALLVVGAGLGGAMAPAINVATYGVAAEDAGVASATVNTVLQVGGAISIAVLNTLATGAASDHAEGREPTEALLDEAALRSYATAYWWSAALFLAGAAVCYVIYRPGKAELDPQDAQTVPV
ncbi:MFS transporter [Streptomyces anulatus]|uniref:MFS transporter n=1 Tax=Streptomyces anulatus TaxID=1892 RepID=UPI00053A85F1|nr:MFS transporter [Streptomyces anulatus]